MELELAGHTALITGASSGIGAAIARLLASEGVSLALVGRDRQRLERSRQNLSETSPSTIIEVQADVAITSDASRIVEAVHESFGGLDWVIHAAGDAPVALPSAITDDVWRRSLETKLLGAARLNTAALPALKRSQAGVIVHIVGTAGRDPYPLLTVNSVVNAGLLAYAKCLADELAPFGIRVVAVSPGWTETPLLHAMAKDLARYEKRSTEEQLNAMRQSLWGRLPTAQEIAAAVMFLLSSQAGMVTGTTVDVDGGVRRGLA